MSKIELVVKAFSDAIMKNVEKVRERNERLENAWSEANDLMIPNRDNLGRLHAPCDGYALPITLDYAFDVNTDKLYRKGEYLPVPLCNDDSLNRSRANKSFKLWDAYRSKDKIKVDSELASEIIERFEDNVYIQFGKGKSWEVNGKEVCYLYLSAYVEIVFKEFVTAIREAIENTDVKEKPVYTGEAFEGRVKVTGTVIRVKEVARQSYSYWDSGVDEKMLVLLDNDSTCYGTVPSSAHGIKEGDKITFTATFEKAKDSNHHSFYKRPSKFEFLEVAEVIEN